MNKPKTSSAKFEQLRITAEELLRDKGPASSQVNGHDLAQLVHELEVHQAELEIQNEELRLTQAKLEDARDQYFDLYDQAPVGYLSTDAKGRILQANLTIASMLAMPRGNLVGRSLYLCVARDHHKTLLDLLKSGSGDRGKQTLAIEMIRKDGSRFHAQVESATQLDDDGLLLQFRMAIVDVTERKRTEYRLSRSEERYRRLLETMPDGVFTLLPDGTIGSLNPAFEKITGFNRDDWLGRNFWDLLHPDDLGMAKEVIQTALAGKGGIAEETRILSSTGGYLIVYFIVEPEFEAGKVTGVWAVGRDITRRKKAERALRKSRDILEAEVHRRTLELSQANQALREGLEKRKKDAAELREQKVELEFKTVELEEANTALRVLMRRGEEDKEELENAITQQTHRLLVPRLQGLLESGLDQHQQKVVNLLVSQLRQITSSFAQRLNSPKFGLTPREIQVAMMIREGLASKEIAEVLKVSGDTVATYRHHIRRKIGILGEKVSLSAHLSEL
ncbi:MAG: PAS domain S-box protein [Proteobacteria bacterium]|nr:PAS domain S-box protein [Pseudomonadota bacterium]MBU4275262.1 PAS domain S-box protein [Pseudomonadota bacterium]MBU4382539.1 PAS domain S-box protein [Pseudomonadota bacterium]MCG2765056.1 PAS domain S-box protein [Desulfarculaceae bacterium]